MSKPTIETRKPESDSPVLRLRLDVFEDIVSTIGTMPAETGGVIGGSSDSTALTHFLFDKSSRNSSVTYSPDYLYLNHHFKTQWNPEGIELKAVVHSHPGTMSSLSHGDVIYAEQILKANPDLDYLWLPIINTVPDAGRFKLTPWAVYLDGNGVSVVRGRVQVPGVLVMVGAGAIRTPILDSLHIGLPLDEIEIDATAFPDDRLTFRRQFSMQNCLQSESSTETHTSRGKAPAISNTSFSTRTYDLKATFDRVQTAYDLSVMKTSRILAVGAGGAAGWLEELARAGLGQFVLIDPDVVTETNLATQQVYRCDIGRPKVDCIAERIRDINPTANVIAFQKSLDDFSDEEIRGMVLNPIDGCRNRRTVICGLTDDFPAQARVNRLALQLGLPSLSAQLYREGRGGEVVFTYPGVTPACQRCILSSRYHYFLEQDGENTVTSHGTPIFATARLNALKGFVLLALLHHGSDHPRWGNLLARIGRRNLIQIRMDPDFAKTMKIGVFDQVFKNADKDRLLFDEAVWISQEPENPHTGYPKCPDCGGKGRVSAEVYADQCGYGNELAGDVS